MKVITICPQCFTGLKEGEHPNFIFGNLNDRGLILVKCVFGHEEFVVFNARRHEVLLGSDAHALSDGYKNEAIAVLSSALERCYEFYLRVVFRERNIDKSNFESSWKNVSSQSERQMGAFLFTYLMENGSSFELNTKIPELRNKIVHKGRIASQEEATEYSELVYKAISEIENLISEKYCQSAEKEAEEEIAILKKIAGGEKEVMVMKVTPAVVFKNGIAEKPKTFLEYMQAKTSGKSLTNR